MIVNKKLIQRLIRESISNIIFERKESKVASYIKNNFLSIEILTPKLLKLMGIPTNENTTPIYEKMEAEVLRAKRLIFDSVEKNEENLLNFLKSMINPLFNIGRHFVNDINDFKKAEEELPKIQSDPAIGNLIKSFQSLNDKNEQKILEIASNPLLSKLFFAFIVTQIKLNFTAAFLQKSEGEDEQGKTRTQKEKEAVMQSLHRSEKKKFIEKNKEELKNWKMIHYPNAFLVERNLGDQFTAAYTYLEKYFGKINEHEMAGVAYPKDFPKINDSLATGIGNYSGRPGLGILLDGFITFIQRKDIVSSTFDYHTYGGHRKSSGFVRYPGDKYGRDLYPTSFSGDNLDKNLYLQDLPSFRKNFKQGGSGYTEGFIDNSFPIAIVGNINDILVDISDKTPETRAKAIESANNIINLGIEIQDENFKVIPPNDFKNLVKELLS